MGEHTGLPSSLSLRLIPCCVLDPLIHNTLPCLIALCYVPRLEMLNFGGVIAAFRYTDNVGFQDHQNFWAYNLHFHCIAPGIPFPQLHISLLPDSVSVLRCLTFPHADFHQLASMSFARASVCSVVHSDMYY